MEYYLNNKDRHVLKVEMDPESNQFTNIIEKLDFNYAPVSLFHASDLLEELNYWYHNRFMPDYRVGFYDLLENLELFELYDYHPDFYSISMVDQYWIIPCDSNMSYASIHHMKEDLSFYNASFLNQKSPLDSYNNINITSEGMLPKAWIGRKLYKGSVEEHHLEPFNERLAYLIGKALGLDIVRYRLDTINEQTVSVCDSFIDENTEFIVAEDLFNEQDEYHLDRYIEILSQSGISNAREAMNDMMLLDYLIKNSDRHMHNFGILRDVNTLEVKGTAPLFDHGTSLLTGVYFEYEAKYFKEEKVTFDFIKECIHSLDYPFHHLEEVFVSFKEECKKYPVDEKLIEDSIELVKNQLRSLYLDKLIKLLEEKVYDPNKNTIEEIVQNILFVCRKEYTENDYYPIQLCIEYLIKNHLLSYKDENRTIETDEGFAEFNHRLYHIIK